MGRMVGLPDISLIALGRLPPPLLTVHSKYLIQKYTTSKKKYASSTHHHWCTVGLPPAGRDTPQGPSQLKSGVSRLSIQLGIAAHSNPTKPTFSFKLPTLK
jgi:hypothetical protein